MQSDSLELNEFLNIISSSDRINLLIAHSILPNFPFLGFKIYFIMSTTKLFLQKDPVCLVYLYFLGFWFGETPRGEH